MSASLTTGVLQGCSTGGESEIRTLTGDRLETVATIAEHIIPETDTPGARGAEVHLFIENMLSDFYEAEERQRFIDGLQDLEARAEANNDRPFIALPATAQVGLLRALEAEEASFFSTMKALTLTGYYTSEVGATQELHVPPYGDYLSDIPFSQVGRTWAGP